MFSLIAVICQSANCITYTPPVVYPSEDDCMRNALVLHTFTTDDPNLKLIEITCYSWQAKV